MKRLFPNQAEAIANGLYAILEKKKRASRVLQQTVEQHPKWGSRDRKLLYESVYSILRWKIKYSEMAQLSEDEFRPWSWIKTWCILNDYAIPDWKEMNCTPFATKEALEAFDFKTSSIKHSFPAWLHQLGERELGTLWESEMKALNRKADVSLRVNRLLISPKKLAEQLKTQFQIETRQNPNFPDALLLSKGIRLEKNPLFRRGYFEIQDMNSQQIAPFCQVKEEMQLIDLCAGAGGKTLHLAALMRNKGVIRAFDVEANKLRELHRRAKRAKATIIESSIIDEEVLAKNKHWADIVLIDAPCSGLGTLKRNPEIKWNLSLDQLREFQHTQRALFQQAVPLVNKKGKIIYATCSILPSENREQLNWFLNQYPTFQLEEEKQIFANDSNFDGFYMVQLGRKH